MRAELSDFLRVSLHDALLGPIAESFMRQQEPIWAGASLLAALEKVDELRLAHVFRQLGRSATREEHNDWLLGELEQRRSELISKKIVESRSDPLWRELRARLAVGAAATRSRFGS
ncbi:MAG: hypothetical protein HC927_04075 [Deltaproteobacteria bacterium]|nr:hypothetical protein [Deltaproteobacteria bacterium]